MPYSEDDFLRDLKRLPVSRPTPFVERFIQREQGSGEQDEILFFGGNSWESCETDLHLINKDVRADLVVHLFVAVLMDQHIFSDFRSSYAEWCSRHPNYLKFGYSGQGPHDQHPFLILLRPVETGLVAVEEIGQRLDHAISLLDGYIEELPDHERENCKQRLLQVLGKDAGVQSGEVPALVNLIKRLHGEWD